MAIKCGRVVRRRRLVAEIISESRSMWSYIYKGPEPFKAPEGPVIGPLVAL